MIETERRSSDFLKHDALGISISEGGLKGLSRILWLHDMGDPHQRRASVESVETMLSRYAKGHQVLVHDARVPLTNDLSEEHWDAIFLGPTFLCNRYSQTRLEDIELRFGWVGRSNAVKVALPQDDYDCSKILDEWLLRWSVDVCYSILPKYSEVLYPTFSRFGEIRSAYTGYIDDEWVIESRSTLAHQLRPVDVFYRASRLPANFGSLGLLKAEIADTFLERARRIRPELNLDISCAPGDAVLGTEWHRRLGEAKFTLAAPSGSSLLDPIGSYRQCVKQCAPGLDFAEIEQNCFPGQDNVYAFEVLSPRHIEAALWGTVQIAVEGDYSGIFEPNVHYFPLKRDLGNIEEVLEMMQDTETMANMRAGARARILDVQGLRASHVAQELLELVPRSARNFYTPAQGPPSSVGCVVDQQALDRASARYWRRQRPFIFAKRVLDMIGLGKAARQFRDFVRVEK